MAARRAPDVWLFSGSPVDAVSPRGSDGDCREACRLRPRPVGLQPEEAAARGSCSAQGRTPHVSFLLNALHRVSLTCASLWFESQKEGGRKGKHNSVCHLSTTEKRRQWASDVLAGAPWARVGRHTEALLGPSLALGDLDSGGRCGQALRWGFSYVTSQRRTPSTLVIADGQVVSIFLSRYTMCGPVWQT